MNSRFKVWMLRLLAPICERERQEYRHALHMAKAHANDLTRTVMAIDSRDIQKAINSLK